jgi:hypothetical protein
MRCTVLHDRCSNRAIGKQALFSGFQPKKSDVIITAIIGFVIGILYSLNDHFGWIRL